MMEQLAQAVGRPVSRETVDRLTAYVKLLRAAAREHNLIAHSTLDSLWDRHIIDSAQLIRLAPDASGSWVDVGSGAGLPGLVLALLTDGPVTLVEPRRLRAEFLRGAVGELGLEERVTVVQSKAEQAAGAFDVITARAVAPLPKLLQAAHHLSHSGTVWLLPKGRSAKSELAEARRSWQCSARTEASCTDPQATILVLSKVGMKR